MSRLALVALASAACAGGAPAHAQPAGADGGYEVTRTQTVTNAPSGSVGRKTTDRETRIGNTEETDGNSATYSMTIGGFARECPTSDGIARGTFEYSVSADIVNTDEGETQRAHHSIRASATLEAHVSNEGSIEYVEGNGQVTRERDGTAVEQRTFPMRFTPRRDGRPDMPAMQDAILASGDLSSAILIWSAGQIFLDAELEWLKLNECVELSFEPATETRALGPNASANVRVLLRTKDGGQPVAEATLEINAIQAIGTAAPREGETDANGSFPVKYTASSTPRAGHGLDVGAISRAGRGNALWKIVEGDEYELLFESTIISRSPEEAARSSARGTVRLTGSKKVSPLYGDERRLYNGSGTLSISTEPLPGRDPCTPLVSGAGTTKLTVVDAHIDVSTDYDASGKPVGGRASVEMAYGVGFASGETMNTPMVVDFKCVLSRGPEPYPFWSMSYLSSREPEEINFLKKDGWMYVGETGVVATKTLRGNCGGLCEEVSVFTLRRVDAAAGASGGR